jgi:hypothetical protein
MHGLVKNEAKASKWVPAAEPEAQSLSIPHKLRRWYRLVFGEE